MKPGTEPKPKPEDKETTPRKVDPIKPTQENRSFGGLSMNSKEGVAAYN